MALFFFATIAVAVTIFLVFVVVRGFLRTVLGRRILIPVRHPGKYQNCQYVLSGLPRTGKCPECSCAYDVGIPIDTKVKWLTARDASRTMLRAGVLLAVPLIFILLQYPFTYAHLRLADYSSHDAAQIARMHADDGSQAIFAAWLIPVTILLLPFIRVMWHKEYWRTIALYLSVSPLTVFLAGFHMSNWNQGIFVGFTNGELTVPALFGAVLTLVLTCGSSVPRWIHMLERRCGVKFGLTSESGPWRLMDDPP